MTPEFIAQLGGIWAFFLFFHFLFDWVFQSHKEAMNKSAGGKQGLFYLTKHCLTYSVLFGGLFYLLGMRDTDLAISVGVLFVSHMVEDTYIPVFLWFKWVRRIGQCVDNPGQFKVWISSSPLGLILLIGVDQIVHMAFLFVPAYLYLT